MVKFRLKDMFKTLLNQKGGSRLKSAESPKRKRDPISSDELSDLKFIRIETTLGLSPVRDDVGGEFRVGGNRVLLFNPNYSDNYRVNGFELMREISNLGYKNVSADILDLCMENPHRWPGDWKGEAEIGDKQFPVIVYFFGSLYYEIATGRIFVRGGMYEGDMLVEDIACLSDDFDTNMEIAVAR